MVSEFITSIISGGITGLFGASITHYFDYLNKKLDVQSQDSKQKNEITLREMDSHIMQLEWQARNEIAVTESDSRVEVADSEAFKAALTSEPKLYSNPSKYSRLQNTIMVFVDSIRGLIRPVLTVYLCGVTTAVYMQAGQIIKAQPLSVDQSVEVYTQISSTILYLTTTCVLFWFGSRTKEKSKSKINI